MNTPCLSLLALCGMATVLVVTSLFAAEVDGLAVLSPTADDLSPGEAAARDLAFSWGARELRLEEDGRLIIPPDVKAVWWHSEAVPLPGAMQSSAVRRSLLEWLAAGHGLFLSGTALAYVHLLGLEPTSPRMGHSGNDAVVAGVTAADFASHPIYQGLDTSGPILLASAGFPAFSDFHGSGGPLAANILGHAHPDAGENPLVELGHGAGRVIALGWRLPYYGLATNAYRANLERLTFNIVQYLAAGQWFGTLPDPTARLVRQRLDLVKPEAVRRAIADLAASFPERYTRGAEYLAALEQLPAVRAALERGEATALGQALRLLSQLAEALLANPLLDFDRLLLVKRSEGNLGLPQNWESNSTLPRTGFDNELAVLSPLRPNGELTTLYRPPGGEFVGDVDLDFDARRLLFSMPAGGGPWRVYELPTAGGTPVQLPLIPDSDVDNYDACYLPDGNIVFTSTAPFVGVPCVTGASHVATLYHLDRTTGRIRQLTFEQDHDWCPTVMNDGRVLYLRWEYSDLPHFASRILFTMNPDGTGQRAFYGSNSYWPNALFYARPIPGHPTRFVAIVGGHHDNPRMGELVLFDAALGQYEADGVMQRIPGCGKRVEPVLLDGLTAGSWPKFLHPYPLSDKYFLVSCKPTPASPWGIYLADVFDNLTLIREEPGYALLEPIPLRPTPRPPVIANRVDPARQDALIYLADIYRGPGLEGVPRGTVKKLRLFTYHFAYHGMGGQVNRVGLDGPWDIKRVLGTVPVEADGSAFFQVPANTPISLQPLDAQGQALQLMRSWLTAMPGETLSCVGCHEPANAVVPAPSRTIAGRRAASPIAPWYGPTRGFSFQREVQPVLDRHCVACHNGSARDPGNALPDFRALPSVHPDGPDNAYQQGSLFPPAYLALKRFVRGHTIESDMHLLMPGEFAADTTWLVRMLRKGHHGVRLSDEDWDRLITWIDLNTPAHGTWHEVVGEAAVNHLRQRRRETMKLYAGRDEDPETIHETTYGPPEPAPPASEGAPTLPACDDWPFDAAEATRRQRAEGPWTRTVVLAAGVTLDLVRIPAGEFLMGSPGGYPDERPVTRVRISRPFWMGRCEISNAQYATFDPSHDSRHEEGDFLQFSTEERGYPVNRPDQPVLRVSWDQAMAFCRWLSQRTGQHFTLPTEAQWEWACRAGSDTPLWFGDTASDFTQFANLADANLQRVDTFAPWALPSGAIYPWRPAVASLNDGHRVSAPIGSFRPNPWGLHDMHGNAAEWTLSTYLPYPYQDSSSTPATPDAEMVVRGGSWYDPPHRACSYSRRCHPRYRGVFDVGFRLVEDS